MTPEQKLELKEAEIRRLKQDLAKTCDLVEYYRQFAPQYPSVSVPPSRYFARLLPDGKWGWGWVVDGRIEVLGKGLDDEPAAVAACWTHHDNLGK